MAKLKFEIDTDDMFQDYDEEFGHSGESFEQLFKDGLSKEIKNKVTAEVSKTKIDEITKTIKEEVHQSVEDKLSNLINEEVAFTDGWGEPKFVGSVEDYIKKQIDEKMLSPVDSSGKALQGCTSNTKTWIKWTIGESINNSLSEIKRIAQRQATDFCKNTLYEELEKFKNKTLRGTIVKHLDSLGVIKS